MKDTAIEWFFIQLTEIDYGCINKTFLQNDNTLAGHKLRELFEQAKEMEKEQMLNAFQESRLTHPMIGFKHETFVDYYKQTFK